MKRRTLVLDCFLTLSLLALSIQLEAAKFGINVIGYEGGGAFYHANNSGYSHIAAGDFGILAGGNAAGGKFEDIDNSGYAYVASNDDGIAAYGSRAGGTFGDTNNDSWAHVGSGSHKIYGNGAVSFVQNHPDLADLVIVYTAPEGDEVATYTRGTAKLVNGEARIPLGETFKWVTNPDIGLTAHLTPIASWAALYVDSISTEEVIVKAAAGSSDDAKFNYIVYGLRIGFEESTVVQEKTGEAYIPSMNDHRAMYIKRTNLRHYNALERFGRMRAANGLAAMPDMSAAKALREKIKEYDPVSDFPISD